MQLLGNPFEYELGRRGGRLNVLGATSGDTGSAAEYAMQRQARHPGLHALAARPDEPVPAGADVQPAGRQHPQPRDRGRVRRLPGHRQGRLRRPRVQAPARDRHRQLDQLGAPARPGRLLLRRLLPGDAQRRRAGRLRRADRQLRQHLRRPRRAQMGLPIRRLVLATNENDVLDEFFRTGIYRVRGAAETHETSSPSMDISKASNFERFVFDAARPRRGAHARALRRGRDASARSRSAPASARGSRRSASSAARAPHRPPGDDPRRCTSASARSIDPHTADALQVARAQRRPGGADDRARDGAGGQVRCHHREAIGRDAPRPARLAGLEALPRRFATLGKDTKALMAFIAEND